VEGDAADYMYIVARVKACFQPKGSSRYMPEVVCTHSSGAASLSSKASIQRAYRWYFECDTALAHIDSISHRICAESGSKCIVLCP
jgi:hypothetical protein